MDMGDLVITGCADMIDGFEIRDIKTKYSQPNDKDYVDSAQWRFYLEMFGAETFHFDLFQFIGYDKEKHGTDVRGLNWCDTIHQLLVTTTALWSKDNRYLIDEFVRWAKSRGVYDLLPEYNQETINNLH